MPIRIALPKGRLLRKTSALLQKAGWGLDDYNSRISFYRPKSPKFPDLQIKVLHEKDIPIQVAVGNYDLGIGSCDWVEELLVKYPSSALVKIRDLGYGQTVLCVVAGMFFGKSPLEQIKSGFRNIRIVSEYPNLAESFALKNRLSRFSVFPVWGAAEVYPPENAELALISVKAEAELDGMMVVSRVLDSSAFLIANRDSWEKQDLGEVVNSICGQLDGEEKKVSLESGTSVVSEQLVQKNADIVWFALPDGHQQQFTVELLRRAGIQINDYPSEAGNRRPTIKLDGVMVKVIRPQDMPLQVANGNFDLAITGRDWLAEHLYQFPSSPAREVLHLGFGRVKMVAVVSQGLPANDVAGLRQLVNKWQKPLRVASEYVQIADRYARENHLGPYRVIPTWGATEAFLPDDADLLIENTETGRTIARHNLKIIDTVSESTACLVGNASGAGSRVKRQRIDSIVRKLRATVGEV